MWSCHFLYFVQWGPSYSATVHMIQLMPNLKFLYLEGNLIDIPQTSLPADAIKILLLESLDLSQIDDLDDNQDLRSFLSSMWMPVLQTSTLDRIEQDLSQFVQGVCHSSRTPLFPVVQCISLHHISNRNWTADASFFLSMPSICSFNLHHNDIHTPTILKLLQANLNQPADTVFWPYLEDMRVQINHQHLFDTLCDLVTYRQSVRKPITDIIIFDHRDGSDVDLEEGQKWLWHHIPKVYFWPLDMKQSVCPTLHLLLCSANHCVPPQIPNLTLFLSKQQSCRGNWLQCWLPPYVCIIVCDFTHAHQNRQYALISIWQHLNLNVWETYVSPHYHFYCPSILELLPAYHRYIFGTKHLGSSWQCHLISLLYLPSRSLPL